MLWTVMEAEKTYTEDPRFKKNQSNNQEKTL